VTVDACRLSGAQCDAAMIRFAILRNVGHCFVKLGQFQDAIHSYEAVMDAWPDPHSGAMSNRNTWMSALHDVVHHDTGKRDSS